MKKVLLKLSAIHTHRRPYRDTGSGGESQRFLRRRFSLGVGGTGQSRQRRSFKRQRRQTESGWNSDRCGNGRHSGGYGEPMRSGGDRAYPGTSSADWYYMACAAAMENGILPQDGSIAPGSPVTRAEVFRSFAGAYDFDTETSDLSVLERYTRRTAAVRRGRFRGCRSERNRQAS